MDAADIGLRNRLARYDDIAREYYDSARHPTCASLRQLSISYLIPRLRLLSGDEGLVLEVGVGRSTLAPVWHAFGFDPKALVLQDRSPAMLTYSAEWEKGGARLAVADADATGLPDSSTDVIVASLGDPYNTSSFWREVARVLRPGGVCHFTTPAHEWARRFRSSETRAVAEFVRADGTVLYMPSPVYTDKEQATLFSAAGLRLVDSGCLTLKDLDSAPAPKLLCVSKGEPVVRGYSVQL